MHRNAASHLLALASTAFLVFTSVGAAAPHKPATTETAFTVTTLDDSGPGSLRQVMLDANADTSGPHTITFTVAGTIALTSTLPTVTQPMTITGPGAGQLTISGNNTFGIFVLQNAVSISGVTIRGGHAANIAFSGGFQAGADLTIDRCVIRDNTSGGGTGSAIAVFTGTTTVTNSLFTNNTGNVLLHGGNAAISNSTFSNSAAQAVYFFPDSAPASVTMRNVTIADQVNAIFFDGRFNAMSLTIGNTILASSNSNAFSVGTTVPTITSLGGNISDDGTLALAGPGDLVNTNPVLAPLGNYGGPIDTRALLPGSPAIDHGVAAGAPATDQRGIARPQLAAVDTGAFESRGFTIALNGGSNQIAMLNSAFANPLSVSVAANVAGEPVNGGQVTYTPPGSGASASLAPNPATVAGGIADTAATANGNLGSYVVTSNAAGAAGTVSFNLENSTTPVMLQSFDVE